MAFGAFENVGINGICTAVPCGFIETDSYKEKFGEPAVKKFKKIAGVMKRPVSVPEQTASDLCFAAAERLLEHLGWDRSSIDALIFVVQVPDYRIPATACVLQHRLGLSENCLAFDINLGCSGYVYGMYVASSLIQSGIKRVLLLVGDTPNKLTSKDDRSQAMLYGDAGTATALEASDGKRINFLLRTGGSGFKHIIVPSGAARNTNGSAEPSEWGEGIIRNDFQSYMNGAEVFSFSVDKPVAAHNDFVNNFKIDINDIDLFVFHQANKFIIESVAQRLDISAAKIPISLDRFGNTSSASMPLTIIDACAGRHGNFKLLLNGFGVGLSWGLMNIEINSDICLPIIYSDDYYKDGALEHV